MEKRKSGCHSDGFLSPSPWVRSFSVCFSLPFITQVQKCIPPFLVCPHPLPLTSDAKANRTSKAASACQDVGWNIFHNSHFRELKNHFLIGLYELLQFISYHCNSSNRIFNSLSPPVLHVSDYWFPHLFSEIPIMSNFEAEMRLCKSISSTFLYSHTPKVHTAFFIWLF